MNMYCEIACGKIQRPNLKLMHIKYKYMHIHIHTKRVYTYPGAPGLVHEVSADEKGGNDEHHPGRGGALVPAQVLAQPQQRVQVLVLAPTLVKLC